VEIWKKVLQKDTIALSDMFFDIGGDSLSCMKVISTIDKEKSLQLSYVTFIKNDLRQIVQIYNDQLTSTPLSGQENGDKKPRGFMGKLFKK
jgi:hypothetical protein